MASCAIGLTAVFLVVVLADIVMQGLPAFIAAPAGARRHGRSRPRSIRREHAIRPSIRGGDFQALVRNALRAQFPGRRPIAPAAGCSMASCRRGAADALRERVVADPALVGQTVKVPVLLSDDADLYLQGHRHARSTGTPAAASRRRAAPPARSRCRARPTISRPTSVAIKRALSVKAAQSTRARRTRLRRIVRAAGGAQGRSSSAALAATPAADPALAGASSRNSTARSRA